MSDFYRHIPLAFNISQVRWVHVWNQQQTSPLTHSRRLFEEWNAVWIFKQHTSASSPQLPLWFFWCLCLILLFRDSYGQGGALSNIPNMQRLFPALTSSIQLITNSFLCVFILFASRNIEKIYTTDPNCVPHTHNSAFLYPLYIQT